MASSLKNVSALLSPRFLSPLSPAKNMLGIPKSDGKVNFFHINKSSSVCKKLVFSELDRKYIPNFSHPHKILPNIQIHEAEDPVLTNTNNNKILEINTPNKLDLIKNGLGQFRNKTTVLGKGTFGTVFCGSHKGRNVAVKILCKEDCAREKNALFLNHKNIVKTLEIVQNPDHENYCLVIMEYLPNSKNLQTILEERIVDEQLLKTLPLDITTGLSYCHKNGILHLDLKPKNILVMQEKVCKICDFGNSVKIAKNLKKFNHNGTIIYTAPEILLGKSPTIKSDIYSLGLIFWQLKYRQNPFQIYDNNESIIYNVGKHNVRPFYDKKDSDCLTKIFTKCWQNNPESRPDTVEILKKLEKL